MKIALLGCGVVGTEVVRLLREQADDLAARVGVPLELAGIAVRRLDKRREGVPQELLTTDAMGLVTADDVDIVVEVIGGIEPARALHARRDEGRQVGRHGQQGAAGRGRRDAVRRREGVRRRHLLRGVRRGRDPAAAAAARVARRRPRPPGDGHRQRHDQLHPRQDGLLRRRVLRRPGRGAGPRVRRGRPDRRRRGLRRGGQGRDPRPARVPHPGHRRGRAPRGHHRGHRGRHRQRQGRWAVS